ncbi:MAG: signal peptidase II [Anaerolineae bacterium]
MLPGLWAGYVGYVVLSGGLPTPRDVLVALWPVVPLYIGACLLARSRSGKNPRLWLLLALGVLLAAADWALKAWLEVQPAGGLPLTLLPGLLAIDPVYNVHGTMLAIPGAAPFITILAMLLVPLSIWGYREYLAQARPAVVWGHAAFVGFFAGALAKAGDLLMRGLILDYLHIPGLPVADLADVYLLWVGAGCVLAAALSAPSSAPTASENSPAAPTDQVEDSEGQPAQRS